MLTTRCVKQSAKIRHWFDVLHASILLRYWHECCRKCTIHVKRAMILIGWIVSTSRACWHFRVTGQHVVKLQSVSGMWVRCEYHLDLECRQASGSIQAGLCRAPSQYGWPIPGWWYRHVPRTFVNSRIVISIWWCHHVSVTFGLSNPPVHIATSGIWQLADVIRGMHVVSDPWISGCEDFQVQIVSGSGCSN